MDWVNIFELQVLPRYMTLGQVHLFLFKCLLIIMYLKVRERERGWQWFSIFWFTSLLPPVGMARPGQSQEPWVTGTQVFESVFAVQMYLYENREIFQSLKSWSSYYPRSPLIFIILFKNYLSVCISICLSKSVIKIFHLLSHSPDGYQQPGMGQAEVGIRSFIWVSHVSAGPKYLGHSSLLSQ